MAVELIHPTLPGIQPRAVKKAAALSVALTGRWVSLDSSGLAVAPAAAAVGVYFIYEGTHQHAGDGAAFDPGGLSTNTTAYPTNVFAGTLALLYGNFIASVGYEGVDQADVANIIPGALLKVDTVGRLVSTNLAANNAVAKVESRVVDGAGKISSLTFRSLPG